MKKEGFLWAVFGIGLILGIGWATTFRQSAESSFGDKVLKMHYLQNCLRSLQDDEAFFREHQATLKYLSQKKWNLPENRLIAGERLEKVGTFLHNLHYTFEPEQSISYENGNTYTVTKIDIDVESNLDTDVYLFLEALLTEFPGILTISEISLALTEEDSPPYIKGKLVLDWFTLGRTS